MNAPKIDSRAWTGEIGQPAPLPYHLQRRAARPLWRIRSATQGGAIGHAILLALSPLLFFLSGWLLRSAIGDLAVGAPDLTLPLLGIALAGGGLALLADRDLLVRWCGRVAFLGWVLTALAACAYFVAGLHAHQVAVAGPIMRAQIEAQERDGRHSVRTIFRLQDGSLVASSGFGRGYGNMRRCYAVRWLEGLWGFAWLRIVDASPGPGPGQLDWPVERRTCFSPAPLSSMAG